MKKILFFLLLFGLFVGLVGCNNNDDEKKSEKKANEETSETKEKVKDAKKDDAEKDEDTIPALEKQKTVKMMVEGTPKDKIVNLYSHKELGFSTYVPDDMVVESNPDVFNVYTNYGGNKNENATLKITNQTEEEMTKTLSDNGFSLDGQNTKVFDFSNKEFILKKAGVIGRVALFQHNDKDYALYYYYPEEFADGFGPRSDIIIKEIVWHDK